MAILGAVLNEGGFRRHLIFIEDVGTGGLKFRSDIPYEKHDIVELLVQLVENQYTVRTKIRHVTQDWFGYVCGVQFIDPDPAFVRHISVLFSHLTPDEAPAPSGRIPKPSASRN